MSAHRNIQLKSRRFGACLMVFFALGCAPAELPSEQVELLEVAPEPVAPPAPAAQPPGVPKAPDVKPDGSGAFRF